MWFQALGLLLRAAGAAPVDVEIEVVHVQGDEWRAEYRFSEPIQKFTFATRDQPFRAEWAVDGLVLEAVDGKSVLRRKNGRTFRKATVHLRQYSENSDKAYRFFIPFTDGSSAVYLGNFVGGAEDCLESDTCGAASLVLRSELGEPILADGKLTIAVSGEVSEPNGYAYVGNLPPVESELGMLVIDPGMPGWTIDAIRSLLPELLAQYADRLGPGLAGKRTFLFGYDESGAGLGVEGGVLGDQVAFSLQGPLWSEDTHENRMRLEGVAAHEAAHLWNARVAEPPSGIEHSWMHEGGADFLSQWARVAQGRLALAEWQVLFDTQVLECAYSLRVGSLQDAVAAKDHKTVYTCGNVIAMLAGKTVDPLRPAAGHAELWRELLADTRGGSYDEAAYFAVLSRYPGGAATIAAIRELVDTRVPSTWFEDNFARAGVTFERRPPEVDRYENRKFGVRAVTLAVQQDCPTVSLNIRDQNATFADSSSCSALKSVESIDRIGGIPYLEQGLLAYDYLQTRCAAAEPIVVQSGQQTFELPCKTPPPSVPMLTVTAPPL